MSALESLASDDFNRADSADLGASWDAGYTGYNALKIVSNQVQGSALGGNGNVERYNAVTPSANQYSQVTRITYTAGISGGGPMVRMATPATATFMWVDTNGSNQYRIMKTVAGSSTTLATASTTAASGHVMRLEAYGTQYWLYINETLAGSVSDSAIASGSVGQFIYVLTSTANTIHDNWSGGNITFPSFSLYPKLRPRIFAPGLAR